MVAVVDGSALMRERLVLALTHEDGVGAVEQAATVGEAIALGASRPLGALVVDVDHLGGRSLAPLGLARRMLPGVRLLALSAEDSPELREHCLALGADGFFVTPTGLGQLAALLSGAPGGGSAR